MFSAQTYPKPQPCSTIPFKKDPIFIGRKAMIDIIEEKHRAIGQRYKRVALVGLGGVRLAMPIAKPMNNS